MLQAGETVDRCVTVLETAHNNEVDFLIIPTEEGNFVEAVNIFLLGCTK